VIKTATSANIFIGDVVFSVDSDGYPDDVIPLLQKLAKESRNEEEFIGKLVKEAYQPDPLDSWLHLGETSMPSYDYAVDFKKGTITYEEDEEVKVVALK